MAGPRATVALAVALLTVALSASAQLLDPNEGVSPFECLEADGLMLPGGVPVRVLCVGSEGSVLDLPIAPTAQSFVDVVNGQAQRAGSVTLHRPDFELRDVRQNLADVGIPPWDDMLARPVLSLGDEGLARAVGAEATRQLARGNQDAAGAFLRLRDQLRRGTRNEFFPIVPHARVDPARAPVVLSHRYATRTAVDGAYELEPGVAGLAQPTPGTVLVELEDGTPVFLVGVEGQLEVSGVVGVYFGPDGVAGTPDDLPTESVVSLTKDVRLVGASHAAVKAADGTILAGANLIARAGDPVQIYRVADETGGFDPLDPDRRGSFCTGGRSDAIDCRPAKDCVTGAATLGGRDFFGDGVNARGECILLASNPRADSYVANLTDGRSLATFEALAALTDPVHRPVGAVLEPADLTDLIGRSASRGRGLPARPPSASGGLASFPALGGRSTDARTGAPVRSAGSDTCALRRSRVIQVDESGTMTGSVEGVPTGPDGVPETGDDNIASDENCLLWPPPARPDADTRCVVIQNPDGSYDVAEGCAQLLRPSADVALFHSANQNLFHTLCTLLFDGDVGHCSLDQFNSLQTGSFTSSALAGDDVVVSQAIRGFWTYRFARGVEPQVQQSTPSLPDPERLDLRSQLLPLGSTLVNGGVGSFVADELVVRTDGVVGGVNLLQTPLQNLSFEQKGLYGCGPGFVSACDKSERNALAANDSINEQLMLDVGPAFGGIDLQSAAAMTLLQENPLVKIGPADAPVGARDSGPNTQVSTGESYEPGVTTNIFATVDDVLNEGVAEIPLGTSLPDGIPDHLDFLRLTVDGENVVGPQSALDPNRFEIVRQGTPSAGLLLDGVEVDTTGRTRLPPGDATPLLATDFRNEGSKWLVDASAPAGVLLFQDPRGPNGEWDNATGDDVFDPNGEYCGASYRTATRSSSSVDPGCTVPEVLSANLDRILIVRDQLGPDGNHDAPETVAEIVAIHEGRLDLGDPLAGPDGNLFANWIIEDQFNDTGDLLGIYGWRSDQPDAAPVLSSGITGFPEISNYQKAVVTNPSSLVLVEPRPEAGSFSEQCAVNRLVGPSLRLGPGYCYVALDPATESDPLRTVGALPAGMVVQQLVPPSGASVGTVILQGEGALCQPEFNVTSGCTVRPDGIRVDGTTVRECTAGNPRCFDTVTAVVPLQRLAPLDLQGVQSIMGLCPIGPDCAELPVVQIEIVCNPSEPPCPPSGGLQNVTVAELHAFRAARPDLGWIGGSVSGIFTDPTKRLAERGLVPPDLDSDGAGDLDANNDGLLDLIDDGTPGPSTDDGYYCGSGIPGDPLQQAMQLELSKAEREVLAVTFPDGLPPRSPIYCRSSMQLLGLTAADARGERQFLWHTSSPDDPDADGVVTTADNCPFAFNPLQENSGSLTGEPDAIGDACTCGDVNQNGLIDAGDVDTYNVWLASGKRFPRDFPVAKCDVGGTPACTLADVARLKLTLASPSTTFLRQQCPAAGS